MLLKTAIMVGKAPNGSSFWDYFLLSQLKRLELPIEVFIDYKDQIISKGIENYQRGRHGSYFFKILASAEFLQGSNFYKENENQLDNSKIKLDLLYLIEEYFYRIQKSVINDEMLSKKEIEKYLGRIFTDLMLVAEEIQFEDVHKYHYTYIMNNLIKSSDALDENTKNLILRFQSNPETDIILLGEIVGKLYQQYLK